MYKANPELTLKVDKINASDFYHGDGTMLTMLRHTANNPLDISSGVVGNVMIFDTRRIYEMADQLQLSVVGADFGALAGVLLKHGLDIIEIVDNVSENPQTYINKTLDNVQRIAQGAVNFIEDGRSPTPIPPTMTIVLEEYTDDEDGHDAFSYAFEGIVGERLLAFKVNANKKVFDFPKTVKYTRGEYVLTIDVKTWTHTLWRTNKPTP